LPFSGAYRSTLETSSKVGKSELKMMEAIRNPFVLIGERPSQCVQHSTASSFYQK
jgi:hypothetical protein